MSLEAKIQELTEAVIRLTDALNAQATVDTAAPFANTDRLIDYVMAAPIARSKPIAPAPLVEKAEVPTAPASVTPPNPAPLPPVAAVMPPPPVFLAPAAPATVAGAAPFTDGKGLIDYVMTVYKSIGPDKGANIQNVLVGLGYNNINDVKPEHYGAMFAGVEALKG